MTDVAEMIHQARAIRTRLRRPPNAVPDQGIDLKRRFKEQTEIVQKKQLTAVVTIEEEVRPASKVRLDVILRAVEGHYSVGLADIKGRSRRPHLVLPRHIVIHLALKYLKNLSTISIGRLLNRDHTSIIHARNKMAEQLLKDTGLIESVAEIEEAILSGHYD